MDQMDDFPADMWSTSLLSPRFPPPIVSESLPMPPDDRFRLDQDQGRLPVLPDPRQGEPEDTIQTPEPWSFALPVQDSELLPEGKVFQH